MVAKICDFGSSRKVDKTGYFTPSMIEGSPSTMSPEQLTGEKLSLKSDVWQMGVFLWEVFSLQHPWADMCDINDHQALTDLVVRRGVRLRDFPRRDLPDQVYSTLTQLIRRCFGARPESRPSMAEVSNQINSLANTFAPPPPRPAAAAAAAAPAAQAQAPPKTDLPNLQQPPPQPPLKALSWGGGDRTAAAGGTGPGGRDPSAMANGSSQMSHVEVKDVQCYDKQARNLYEDQPPDPLPEPAAAAGDRYAAIINAPPGQYGHGEDPTERWPGQAPAAAPAAARLSPCADAGPAHYKGCNGHVRGDANGESALAPVRQPVPTRRRPHACASSPDTCAWRARPHALAGCGVPHDAARRARVAASCWVAPFPVLCLGCLAERLCCVVATWRSCVVASWRCHWCSGELTSCVGGSYRVCLGGCPSHGGGCAV